MGLRGKSFSDGAASLQPPAHWAPAAPNRARGGRLAGGHRPAPAPPSRDLKPKPPAVIADVAEAPASTYLESMDNVSATPTPVARPRVDAPAVDAYRAPSSPPDAYGGAASVYQAETAPAETQPAEAVEVTYLATMDTRPDVAPPTLVENQAPAPTRAPDQAQAPVADHYADAATDMAANAAKAQSPKKLSKQARAPSPTELAEAQAQGVPVTQIMYPNGRPDDAAFVAMFAESMARGGTGAMNMAFSIFEHDLPLGARLVEDALKQATPSMHDQCELRRMLGNVYRHIGDTAAARAHTDFVAKYSSNRSDRKEAAEKLRASDPKKAAFPEQGGGNAHASPELDAQQARIRDASKQSSDHRRLDAETQQEDTGWALTALSEHGFTLDAGKDGKNIAYHGAEERKGTLLKLVGGRFVRASDDGEVKSTVDESNVGVRQPRAIQEKVKAQFIAKLEKRGLQKEADKMKGLDAIGDIKKLMPAYEAIAQSNSKFRAMQRKARDQVVAEGRMIYVMNRSGEFFAGDSEMHKTHHSTFLAGGAVACAGELQLSGGRPVAISNNSGHYMPGPAALWQAVRQLQLEGLDVAAIQVEVMGAGKLDGASFLSKLDPSASPGAPTYLPFTGAAAIKKVRSVLSGGAA